MRFLEAARETEAAQRLSLPLFVSVRDGCALRCQEVYPFIGTSQIDDILAVAMRVNTRFLPVIPLGNQSATYLYDESTPRILATPGYTAFIKIAEGCDRPCAFCFIPQMRGHFRSRRFGSIMVEAQQLADEGVRELVLVAQDSSRYGEYLDSRMRSAHSCVNSRTWTASMGTRHVYVSDAHLGRVV